MNSNEENLDIKNELYKLMAMHCYQIIADCEDTLENARCKISKSKMDALMEHVKTIVEMSLEAYRVILKRF